MTPPATRRRRLTHPALPALVAALVVAVVVALPAAAESPPPVGLTAVASPSAAVSTAPPASPAATGAAGTPFATPRVPPCPNPPQPSPTTSPSPAPGSPAVTPSAVPTAHPNLCPAPAGPDPFNLIAWLFTPLFQAMFLALALFYRLAGDVGVAIIGLTLVIRLLLYRPSRNQIVSSRRMQALAPELQAIRQKYRGNQAKISEETMRLYKERGVSVLGCLPMFLTIIPLFVLYSVLSSGLSAPDISSMLHVFGIRVLDVPCQDAANALVPCINPAVHWLPSWQPDPLTGNLLNASKPEILFSLPLPIFGAFGVSVLALVSAGLQLIQTRMMTPATASMDPQARAMQRTFLILPLFSIVYGSFLPSGLFIYWIVTTIFSIVQQYLIAGWGSLFPLFGWTPSFARNHKPRFPLPAVDPPPPRAGEPAEQRPRPSSATDRAAGTVRPAKGKARTSRRGRRR